MEQILGIFKDAVTSGALLSAMDKGVKPTIRELGRIAESYLATQVPAFAAVRQECAKVEACRKEVDALRDKVMMDVARTTGLYVAIEAAVLIYQKIPPLLRQVGGKVAVEVLARLDDAISVVEDIISLDPAKAWDNALKGLNALAKTPLVIYDYAADLGKQVASMVSAGMIAVLGPIGQMPIIGPLAKGVLKAGDFAIDAATGALELTEKGLKEIGGVVEDIGEGIEDIGDTVGEGIEALGDIF